MALEKFGLDSLATMDGGRLGLAFRHALQRAEDDCRDRPAVKDPRKILLEITLCPLPSPEGDLDSVDAQIQIVDKLPKRKSKVYNMRSSGRGLMFNDLSPEDVDQGTLDLDLEPRPRMEKGATEDVKDTRPKSESAG